MKRIVPIFLSLLLFITLPLNALATTLDDVKAIIKSDYVGDIKGDLNKATTIDQVIEMLDPYSAFFTKEEYEAFLNLIDMESVGIGVVIEKHAKGILIVEVIESGSAQTSGIEEGDIMISINGQSLVDKSIEEAQSLILGTENSFVEVQLLKENGTTVTKQIQRRSFSIPNVSTDILYGNVGYISLNSFSDDGAELVAEAYTELLNKGAKSFIVDLQNNGGGYVLTAEKLIGMFPGATYAYKVKLSTSSGLVRAIQQGVTFPNKTRLLVNHNSASASEMTAAALLDQKSAILYGEQTYGKGTLQGFYQLADGSILKLTIGEFFGPQGTVVKQVGVKPNIVTTSNPLYQAHYDSIVESLKAYKELANLKDVPTTKTFRVNFNKAVSETVDSNTVKLVKLGSNKEIDVSLKVSDKQLIVTPTTALQAGGEYILIVNPMIKDHAGKIMKNGYYLKITVQK